MLYVMFQSREQLQSEVALSGRAQCLDGCSGKMRKTEMRKEAKMLPIRSEDTLTIPLHHLSPGEKEDLSKGP